MKFIVPIIFLLSACASKPKIPENIDWDDVFTDDPYCGEVLADDCQYYPPYYY